MNLDRNKGVEVMLDMAQFLAHPGRRSSAFRTPSGAHLEPALQAAEAGKHPLIENP